MKMAFCSVILAAGLSLAATLPYQGLATDAKGKPVADGNYTVKFSLYTNLASANPVWTESQSTITTRGLFSTSIGAIQAIPDGLFDGTPLYLGVTFDGRPQSGRQLLATTPWAKQAEKANASRYADSAARCGLADSAKAVPGIRDSSWVLRTKIRQDSIARDSQRRSDSADWKSLIRADSGLIAAQAARIAILEKAIDHQSSILSKAIQSMLAPDRGVPWNGRVAYGFFADPRDGKVYRTVKIRDMTWMAQNLAYAGQDTVLGVCAPTNTDSCTKYGRLYDWSEVMAGQLPRNAIMAKGPQGICPEGWHVPSLYEWWDVTTYTNMNGTAGSYSLKSSEGWVDCHQPPTTSDEPFVCKGSDEYGFRGLPAGRTTSAAGENLEVGRSGLWWHASLAQSDSLKATGSGFKPGTNGIQIHNLEKTIRISLRCLQD